MHNTDESTAEASTKQDSVRAWSASWLEKQEQQLGPIACQKLEFYALPEEFLLSVVVPVFNEKNTLDQLVQRIASVPIPKEIILVDDGCSDGSSEIIDAIVERHETNELNQILSSRHERNLGKGAALKTGFAMTRGDIVLVQDADLEYDPQEYPRLLRPIVDGRADVVFGSRFLGDQAHRVLYFWHYVGNRLLTTLSNSFTNLNLTDMETCFKVFRGNVIREICPQLRQKGFGFEPEITARIARRKLRVYEISIGYSGRTYEEGKKISWLDGVKAIWCILKYAFV